MAGIGGTNMDNRGIDYRERSPLVVPPKLDLPPPVSAKSEVNDPNWPKDPDEARRKAEIKARKKAKPDPMEASRILTPAELNVGRTAPPTRTDNDPVQPGVSNNPILSPSQLGFDGRFSSLFGGNKSESVPFKGEPTREFADPAAARIPDPVAEFRLRHRAEGIAEQGIQPGQARASSGEIRSVASISRLRDDAALGCDRVGFGAFDPNAFGSGYSYRS